MQLKTRMFLLVALLFGILYGMITGVRTWLGASSALTYLILVFVFLSIQYLISLPIVSKAIKVKWDSEKEAPELHRMLAELASLNESRRELIKQMNSEALALYAQIKLTKEWRRVKSF